MEFQHIEFNYVLLLFLARLWEAFRREISKCSYTLRLELLTENIH